jgi:hypothetical protein
MKRLRLVLATIFVCGLGASLLLACRSQVGGDQLQLVARGWLLAKRGIVVPYGNPTSNGGFSAGSLTSIVAGVPMMVWPNHRAPVALIVATHALAFLLLDRTFRKILTAPERLLFAVFYWLNPWRIYLSGFLWNPNYLFVFGAVHAWTSWKQKDRSSFWLSFLHVFGIAMAFQLHPSFLLLVVPSAFLAWRGYVRFHWPGVAAGAMAGAVALIPFALAAKADPSILPTGEGFPGRALIYGSIFRGVGYWIRYGSLMVSEKFVRVPWEMVETLFRVVGIASVIAALAANVWFWRGAKGPFRAYRSEDGDRFWLAGYTRWCFVGSLIVYALAPTTPMPWQGVLLFHAAVLPVVFWCGSNIGRFPRPVMGGAILFAVLSLVMMAAVAAGGPRFRCAPEPDGSVYPLIRDHAMFHDLGVHATCRWPIDPLNGSPIPSVVR